MPTFFDSVRLHRCFGTYSTELIHDPVAASADATTESFAFQAEHSLLLRPEASTLQRWLDLNA